MIILTGANGDLAKDDNGKLYEHFSFRSVIANTISQADKFGYKSVVYDLGALGMGDKFHVKDEGFSKNGYYSTQPQKGYKSKSLFKPEMVRDCLSKYKEFTVYLDGDATLNDSIDEVLTDDYDIGVTLRRLSEMEGEWYDEHIDIVKFVNAGVIFFNPTQATFEFLDKWQEATLEVGNDQQALNKLVCPEKCPDVYSAAVIGGVRIKYFPSEQYNYYYFEEGLEPDIKILHFKGDVRHYYPFNWQKRLYCKTIIPVVNILRPIIKKLVP